MHDSDDAYLLISSGNVIEDVVGSASELLKIPVQDLLGANINDYDILRSDFLRCHRSMEGGLPYARRQSGVYPDQLEKLKWKYYEVENDRLVAKVSRLEATLDAEEMIVDQLADALPMMIAYVDRGWRFLFNNKAYEAFIGLSREQLYKKPISSVITGESFKKLIPRVKKALAGERVDYEDKLTLVDGRAAYFNVSYIPDLVGDEVAGFYAIINDVSEYGAMINILKDVHTEVNRTDLTTQEVIGNLLRDSLTYLVQDIAIISRVEEEKYTVVWCESKDNALEQGTVFTLGDTYCRLTLDHEDVFHTIDAGSDPRFWGHPCYEKFGLETYIGAPIRIHGQVWGTVNFSSHLSRVKPFGRVEIELLRLIVSAVEKVITQALYLEKIKKERDEMTAQARRDQLTGLPNRAYLNEYVGTLIDNPDVKHKGICLAVVDIDHFKPINDTYGHDVGDQVIVWLSDTVSKVLRARDGDFAARIGGEEFVVMINNASLDVARNVMERVRQTVASTPIPINSQVDLYITISGGITRWQTADVYSQVFKRADQALYNAKKNGRNQVLVHI
ncbi:sensor domain-containing diguanylate cyclase [Modicisalibacter radicis]|uniref:sensor domain-containing diguanylate cyclase n=1 Tax=Halomonas sp. EAR18 TaxID=2518972 RepID=UPI001443C682|nr:diguanylate cyclase [Halomonas sp. EAR18]